MSVYAREHESALRMKKLFEAQGTLTDHDVATLSDWAASQCTPIRRDEWRRAYALIREGCDLLLRRRIAAEVEVEASVVEAMKEEATK